MKIDFKNITENIIHNFNGGEKEFAAKIFLDESGNKIMQGKLIPGASIGKHTHLTNCEMLYVISGKGRMLTPEGDEFLSAGDCTYCPKGGTHSLVNDGDEDLIFFCAIPVQK